MAKTNLKKPTAAALRAAQEMFAPGEDGFTSSDRVEMALIIDRETKLPLLLDAISRVMSQCERLIKTDNLSAKGMKEAKQDLADVRKMIAELKG